MREWFRPRQRLRCFFADAFLLHCNIEQLLEAWTNEYACLGYGEHLYEELKAFCEVTGIKAIAL